MLIPYKAKSATTLVALAADELIMGPASELGPIDPQIPVRQPDGRISYVPAYSVEEGLRYFEERAKADPESFPLYYSMARELNPIVVGNYMREIKSARQYAEDLLKRYMLSSKPEQGIEIAHNLVSAYYSHGYVINRTIARDELHLNVLDPSPNLWENMWHLHNLYDLYLKEEPETGTIIQSVNATIEVRRKRVSGPRAEGTPRPLKR